MKELATRALCALTLAGFASTASAASIYFNFTGTVTAATGTYENSGLEGTTVSGGFSFDTENLQPFLSPDLATAQFFDSAIATSQAFLNFGSGIGTPVFTPQGGASIYFADTDCYQLAICHPWLEYQEGFALSASSSDAPSPDWAVTPGFVGTVHQAVLNFSSWEYDFADFANFDWASATPMDIVTQALNEVSAFYGEDYYKCTGEPTCEYGQSGALGFSIDSVTRGVRTQDVPEPGTPVLLALGLAGLYWVRRRHARQQVHEAARRLA